MEHNLWMTRLESHGIYEDIDLWDNIAIGGYWKTMRENKLKEFKMTMHDQPIIGDKIGSEFLVVNRDHLILREDNRPLPLNINPLW